MYFGKLALISYIFSVSAFGVGLLLYNALGWDLYGGYDTFDVLMGIGDRHDQSINATTANPSFIFGDYPAATRAIGTILFDIPTGGQIANLWGSVGGILVGSDVGNAGVSNSMVVYVLLRILISFSSACLIISMLSGRDL